MVMFKISILLTLLEFDNKNEPISRLMIWLIQNKNIVLNTLKEELEMKQKLNFNDALELLLRGEKIYSEVSKCTFLLDDDTIFITDNNGSLSILDRDNEMFTLDEVVGLWTCK